MTSLNTHYLTYDRAPDAPRQHRAQRRHWLWLLALLTVLLLILTIGALYYLSPEHTPTTTASAACDAPIHDRADTAIVENCVPLAPIQTARYGDEQSDAARRRQEDVTHARDYWGLIEPPLISNDDPNHDPADHAPDCHTTATGKP